MFDPACAVCQLSKEQSTGKIISLNLSTQNVEIEFYGVFICVTLKVFDSFHFQDDIQGYIAM